MTNEVLALTQPVNYATSKKLQSLVGMIAANTKALADLKRIFDAMTHEIRKADDNAYERRSYGRSL